MAFIAFAAYDPASVSMYHVLLRGLQRPVGHTENMSALGYLEPGSQGRLNLTARPLPPLQFEESFFDRTKTSKLERERTFPSVFLGLAGKTTIDFMGTRHLPLDLSDCKQAMVLIEGSLRDRQRLYAPLQLRAMEGDTLSDASLIASATMHFWKLYGMSAELAFKRVVNEYCFGTFLIVMISGHSGRKVFIANRGKPFWVGKNGKMVISATDAACLEGVPPKSRKEIFADRIVTMSTDLSYDIQKIA